MRVETATFAAMSGMPNSPLPLVLARGAFARDVTKESAGEQVRRHGWTGTWVWPVFDYWHYHTTGHEVLVVLSGTARVGFGGEEGQAFGLSRADMVLIPAGVGHRSLDASSDFKVLGAYPPRQDGTVVRAGEKTLDEALAEISTLSLQRRDPATGEEPGILTHWR